MGCGLVQSMGSVKPASLRLGVVNEVCAPQLVGSSLCMAELTLEYPDDLLLSSGKQRGELERELKFQLALRLFEVGHLSLGKAAELPDGTEFYLPMNWDAFKSRS